jgi:hypothetical protein
MFLSSFYVFVPSSFLSSFHSIFISVITDSRFFLFLEHTNFPNAFFAVLHEHTNFPTTVRRVLHCRQVHFVPSFLVSDLTSFHLIIYFVSFFKMYHVLPLLHFLVSGRRINYFPEAFRIILHTLLVLLTISSCHRQSCCLSSISLAVAIEDVLTLQ